MLVRAALLACLLIPQFADACRCAPRSNNLASEVQAEWKQAAVVVEAEAVSTLWQNETQAVMWHVLTSWKGNFKATETLRTETREGRCCPSCTTVWEGTRYILYLHGPEPFSVSSCSIGGPVQIEKAQIQILNRLVKGKTPKQSLKPTRVGKPPLAAQRQRWAARSAVLHTRLPAMLFSLSIVLPPLTGT